jgi:hypothetical protein
MHREGPADALGRHDLRQDRVVGRVIDGVAEAGDRPQGDQQPEGRHHPGDRNRPGAEHHAGDQHPARPHAVDQEARRRLQGGGDDVEGRKRQPELGIAHPIVGADEGE